ncbi:hypothetical protein HNP46_007159 [Pseudomonas nitritireducens]|uniref:Uncharacterized protein n=1 Tax=Pseudomonas nitroreducens TaxID=46680 RepID=A0A7W7KTA5_PSENT|nr:hypothetical protein [Pseudomonas nitritireducens]
MLGRGLLAVTAGLIVYGSHVGISPSHADFPAAI